MRFDDFVKSFPSVAITEAEAAACRFLELRGLRFCVDFGYQNAWEKVQHLPEMRFGRIQ